MPPLFCFSTKAKTRGDVLKHADHMPNTLPLWRHYGLCVGLMPHDAASIASGTDDFCILGYKVLIPYFFSSAQVRQSIPHGFAVTSVVWCAGDGVACKEPY